MCHPHCRTDQILSEINLKKYFSVTTRLVRSRRPYKLGNIESLRAGRYCICEQRGSIVTPSQAPRLWGIYLHQARLGFKWELDSEISKLKENTGGASSLSTVTRRRLQVRSGRRQQGGLWRSRGGGQTDQSSLSNNYSTQIWYSHHNSLQSPVCSLQCIPSQNTIIKLSMSDILIMIMTIPTSPGFLCHISYNRLGRD